MRSLSDSKVPLARRQRGFKGKGTATARFKHLTSSSTTLHFKFCNYSTTRLPCSAILRFIRFNLSSANIFTIGLPCGEELWLDILGWLDHTFDGGIACPRGTLVPQFGCENHSKDKLNSTGDVGYHSKTVHMLLRELIRPMERRF